MTMEFSAEITLGNALTIIAMIGALLSVYVQREKDLAKLKAFTEEEGEMLREQRDKVLEIDRYGSTASRVRLEAHQAQIAMLTSKLDGMATTVEKVGVMANDIAWIKQEMKRRGGGN